MLALLASIFVCGHEKTSWPQTPVNRLRRPTGEPCYTACLGCGRRWEFDPATWKRGREIKASESDMVLTMREGL